LGVLAEVKKTLLRAGAETAALSGSGTAVYGLFRDSSKAIRAARQLQGRAMYVFLARTVSRREFEAQLRAPAGRAAFR
jgi:4-diphosphocytidyl-2-C-methyl-D-erythritol kinase